MSLSRISLFIVVVMTIANQLQAATTSLRFAGTVTSVPASIASQFSLGQPITGDYTFDTSAADIEPNVQVGRYYLSMSSFNVSIGSYSVNATMPGDIEVTDSSQDGYIATTLAKGASINGVLPVLESIQMSDPTGTAFDSVANPETIDVTRFARRDFTLDFDNGAQLIGQIDAIFVPEPGMASGLLLLAATLLRWVRNRR